MLSRNRFIHNKLLSLLNLPQGCMFPPVAPGQTLTKLVALLRSVSTAFVQRHLIADHGTRRLEQNAHTI